MASLRFRGGFKGNRLGEALRRAALPIQKAQRKVLKDKRLKTGRLKLGLSGARYEIEAAEKWNRKLQRFDKLVAVSPNLRTRSEREEMQNLYSELAGEFVVGNNGISSSAKTSIQTRLDIARPILGILIRDFNHAVQPYKIALNRHDLKILQDLEATREQLEKSRTAMDMTSEIKIMRSAYNAIEQALKSQKMVHLNTVRDKKTGEFSIVPIMKI